jgi:uncharacterized membrane protein
VLSLSHKQWLLVIFALALLLRLPTAGQKSLWLDEAFSVYQAERAELARPVYVEGPHPPLYYTLLHYWVRLAGAGETAVRLPSVAASLAGVGLLYLIARQLADRQAALLAAGLLALSPLDVWYAQEARMPILVTFFGLAFTLALLWNQLAGALVAAVMFGIGLYVDYVMLPLWVGISALGFAYWWQLPQRTRPAIHWLAASAGGWLLYQDWWSYLHQALEGSIGSVFIFAQIRSFLGIAQLGPLHFAGALLIAALTTMLVTLALSKLVGSHVVWNRNITLLLLIAVLLVSAVMLIPRFFTVKRVLVTGWPYVLLLLAWLLSTGGKWRRWLRYLVLGTSLLTALGALVQPKDDWRGATAYVESHGPVGAIVWLDPRWNDFPYNYYAARTVPTTGSVNTLAETAAGSDEIWLIAERYPRMAIPSSPAEAWLDENWTLVAQQPFYRLEVREYRPR